MQKKKLKIPSEAVYILAVAFLSLAVAMISAANFGVSMIVAPAYLLSLKLEFLTFGQAEYVIQAGLFVVFCIAMRGFKIVYLSSFATCLVYGAALDLWRCIPFFNPARQHVNVDKDTAFCPRHGADLVFRRAVLQDLSLSAGL